MIGQSSFLLAVTIVIPMIKHLGFKAPRRNRWYLLPIFRALRTCTVKPTHSRLPTHFKSLFYCFKSPVFCSILSLRHSTLLTHSRSPVYRSKSLFFHSRLSSHHSRSPVCRSKLPIYRFRLSCCYSR